MPASRLAKPLTATGTALMLLAATLAIYQALITHYLHHVTGRVEEITQTRQPNGTLTTETLVVYPADSLRGPVLRHLTIPPSFLFAEFKPGEPVPLGIGCCDGAGPVRILSWGRVYGLAITLAALGIIMFDIGFFMLLRARFRTGSPSQSDAAHRRNRGRYAHFFGAGDSQRPFDHER